MKAAQPDIEIPITRVAAAYTGGVALNTFAPARLGDVLKIGIARAGIHGSSVPTLAATVGLITAFDAVFGIIVVIAMWALGIFPALPTAPSLAVDLWHIGVAHPVVSVATIVGLAVGFMYARRHMSRRVRAFIEKVRAGFAVLHSPRRYLFTVIPYQMASWGVRIATAYVLLEAFHLNASPAAATAVIVVTGVASMAPTPGGVGAQQMLLVYLLHATTTTMSVVSFSIAMQAGITLVNVIVGMVAMMLVFKTVRPVGAMRTAVAFARSGH
jgi:hypothetical protein